MMKRLLLFLLYLLSLSYTQAKEEIVSFKLSSQNGLPDNGVRYIQQSPTGEMLLMTRYAAYGYDGYDFHKLSDEVFQQLHEASQADHSISKSHDHDNLGNRVVIETDALIYTDHTTGELLRLPVINPQWGKLTQNLKCRVITDPKGRIWISLNGFGLYVYNRQTDHMRHIEKDDGSGLIDTNALVYMTIDRDGNIWVAEEHYGLVRLQTVDQQYEVFYPTGMTTSERAREIRMMTRLHDGRIIIANNAGQVFQADSMLQSIRLIPTDGENYISACTDSLGRLWLGSRINGVNIGGRHYSKRRTDFMLRDSKGRIWTCGLNRPLTQLSLSNDGVFSEQTFFEDIENLQARMMVSDHQGNIYLGTEKGVFMFDPDQLLKDPQAYHCLTDEPVRCLYIDSQQRLWLGTLKKGVLQGSLTESGQPLKLKAVTHSDGLAGDIVQMITEDSRGYICIATQTGCTFVNPQTGLMRSLYITDNQLRNYYEENSTALLANGQLVMGTLDGMIVLRSDGLTEAEQSNSVAITSIYVNGVKITALTEQGWEGDHTENSLTFYASNFSFGNTLHTDYTFFLEGYDHGWSDPSYLNQTSYKNLSPGRYTLHVKSREVGSDWGEETTLNITIRPPFWATWWAYLIYIVLAIIIGYTLYRHLRHLASLRQAIAVEKQLTEYKLKFFTNISHEFRTPLTLIQGSMDKLKALPDAPSSTRAPLSNMQRNVDRMLRLINQLLEFRRMQNNKLSLSLEETDIVAFVYNICQGFHDTADQKHIALTFLPAMKSYTMYIDRGFIDKAVYNLLSNAFKYTPKGGSVTVKVKNEEALKITVEDTGVGVPEDMREKIFDRFQRGQIGRDSLGIGLDLTAELIRTHHGTIRCEANPNGGSIFTIELPTDKSIYEEKDFLHSNSLTLQASPQEEERQGFTELVRENIPDPMNDHRILVVEDDADIAAFLKQELGRYFQVETAADGEEALNNVQSSMPNLVITDAMMPHMNGYELIRRLRKDEHARHLPVIMLTALGAEDQQLKGLEAGADAYITKPFSLPLLLMYCRNLLQRSDRMKDVYAQEEKPAKQVNPEVIMEERDQKLLMQLSVWVDSHLASPELSVDKFAEDMGYGRTTFYAKLKALTGMTPNEYIKEQRLQKAFEMLKDERVTVAEAAYQVGMATPQYLSTTFKKRFGITPTQMQRGESSKS